MVAENFKEKLLYLKLKERDKQAFISAYDNYQDHIYRFVYFKVSNKEIAEDLTSAIFLKTWDYIQNNRLNDFKSLKAFLYKVARNTVIDHYRKESKKINISLDSDTVHYELPDNNQDIAKDTAVASDMQFIEKKMHELKDEYREVIMLRYINELTIAEIAEVLEKNKGNIRVLIYRAMNALKEITKE